MTTIGPYRLAAEVARGGFGAVHRAVAPDGRTVAIKLLLGGPWATLQARRRFGLEAQALARLSHPHVVRILDHGEEKDAPYLVMEWVDGETLQARLDRGGPFAPREAAALVAKLARAVAHCHAQGIVHRDLKPANVLLRGWDGEPLLTDFGLAKDLEASLGASQATREGLSLGTPGWWSPEQAKGELAKVGPATDAWGLGALLFAALTGEPPVRGETLIEHLQALDRDPRSPRQVRKDLPAALEDLTLSCLDRDPLRRPAAAQVAHALEGWLRDGRRAGAQPALLVALGLIVVGACAAVVVMVWPREPALPPPRPAPAPATPPPAPLPAVSAEARSWIARAIELREANDYPGAEQAYDRALELDPDLVEALVDRGTLRFGREDYPGALVDFDRALTLDPRELTALRNRGYAHAALGEARAALADFDRVIAIGPPRAKDHADRGVLRSQVGDLAGCRADFDRALELDPGAAQVWHDRAVLRLREGDRAGAVTDLERALDLARDPELVREVRARLNALAE